MTDDPTTHIGGVWPLGIPVSQSWREIGASMHAIRELRIAQYLEIGVHRGGLASLLIARTIVTQLVYSGIEIDADIIHEELPTILNLSPRATVVIGDVFGQTGNAWLSAHLAPGAPGPALVLCDGGNKPREVQMMAERVRAQDYIMVHDWKREINESDIPPSLNRLEPIWLNGCALALFQRGA